jgi:hypothetical protein
LVWKKRGCGKYLQKTCEWNYLIKEENKHMKHNFEVGDDVIREEVKNVFRSILQEDGDSLYEDDELYDDDDDEYEEPPMFDDDDFDIQEKIESGDIEECPGCGAYNAYSWDLSNMDPNKRPDARDPESDLADIEEDIYHIGAASGYEWECGKCHTHWMEADSPLNHPAYTHSED